MKPPTAAPRSKPLAPAVHADRVIPGGSPLFLSYWGDADELLAILRDLVESVVGPREADGTITHWFFLPYSNPDPHIRLRLFGDPARLWSAETTAAIASVLDPLAAQEVIRTVSFETYDRETYRYGGPKGMELAERVFHLSSAMALDLHDETVFDVESDKELEEIIVPLVASQRALLSATGLPLAEQRALAELATERYARHADTAVPRKQGSALYRKVRDALAERVTSGDVGGAQRERLEAILSEARGVEMHRPFAEWFVDCLHVHSIRLLTTWHPIAHLETTAYHVLQKVVGTEIARNPANP